MSLREKSNELRLVLEDLINNDLDHILANGKSTSSGKRRARSGAQREKLLSENESRRIHEQFAGYLAAVVSQPIGLRASVSPFNESCESMLAYLMDIYKLDANQLTQLLLVGTTTSSTSLARNTTGNESNNNDTSTSNRRRYTWKPEIRLQLLPASIMNELTTRSLEDLIVRVHLFAEQSAQQLQAPQSQSSLIDSMSILDLITFGSKYNTASPLRRASELVLELKFKNNQDSDSWRVVATSKAGKVASAKMVQFGGREELEMRLGVRRDQCDHLKLPHTVGLEFWFREDRTLSVKSFKRLFGFLDCRRTCCFDSANDAPIYKTNGRQFYAFAHIKLSQVAAYPMKASHQLLSFQEKPVNSCEISLEFKNQFNTIGSSNRRVDNLAVINHVRLYVICLAYQLTILAPLDNLATSGFAPDRLQTSSNLDNLLFLPAFSMINQHRLQNNLSQLEDQSLRRVALLLLLVQLTNRTDGAIPDSHKLLIMSIAEHEYLNAHRNFNNTTRQEVEVFRRERTIDGSRDNIKSLEIDTINYSTNNLVTKTRLGTWLSRLDLIDLDLRRLDVLAGLRLVKTALVHNECNPMVDSRLQSQSAVIRGRVNRLLGEAVAEEMRARLKMIISGREPTNQKLNKKLKSLKLNNMRDKIGNATLTLNAWQRLSTDVHMIENDLILHWSDRGLDGLDLQPSGDGNLLGDDESRKLKDMIQGKIRNYLEMK